MALVVAPPLANDVSDINIVQRMSSGAVNLTQVTSMVGQGPIPQTDGESLTRLEDEAQTQACCEERDACDYDRTVNDHEANDRRGNRVS